MTDVDLSRYKMRHNCDRDGCFNKKHRPALELLKECFGGEISAGDVDGTVEREGSGFLRGHHPRLHQNNSGDNLQAIADPVLQFLEQHILLLQERLLLPQQFLSFALQGASRGDIFDAQ